MAWLVTLLFRWLDPDTLIRSAIDAWAKAKDVDLEKFRTAATTSDSMVAHIVEANVAHGRTKAQYALSVLAWWPFRLILFGLLFFPAVHFVAIVLDSSCPQAWGLHLVGGRSVGGCGWGVPAIPDTVRDIYRELLLFFVIAKPADTAISGALALASARFGRR
ncbi:hypothetical protein [Rhodoplanes sp. SY1]|uniref:hypothetical protein n=1 Tax=Rhodoplanes sp. SY1 TaxID=3166646 RepID=UPI0038B650CD